MKDFFDYMIIVSIFLNYFLLQLSSNNCTCDGRVKLLTTAGRFGLIRSLLTVVL